MLTPEAMGAQFHAACEQLLPQLLPHEDDVEHNTEVGRSILRIMNGDDPQMVCDEYNQWASLHGFEMVVYLGVLASTTEDRIWMAAMSGVILGMDRHGTVYTFQDARSQVCQQP
jgi:hypothetical protein